MYASILLAVLTAVLAVGAHPEGADPACREPSLQGAWVREADESRTTLSATAGRLRWTVTHPCSTNVTTIEAEYTRDPDGTVRGRITRLGECSEHGYNLDLPADMAFRCRFRIEGDRLTLEGLDSPDGFNGDLVEGRYHREEA